MAGLFDYNSIVAGYFKENALRNYLVEYIRKKIDRLSEPLIARAQYFETFMKVFSRLFSRGWHFSFSDDFVMHIITPKVIFKMRVSDENNVYVSAAQDGKIFSTLLVSKKYIYADDMYTIMQQINDFVANHPYDSSDGKNNTIFAPAFSSIKDKINARKPKVKI